MHLGIGGVLVVGIAVGATLWATGSFTHVRPVVVSGELFVTTKGGDVKKAAGQIIHLTPVTPESQKSIVALLAKADQIQGELDRIVEEGRGKYLGLSVSATSREQEARRKAFKDEYGPQLSKKHGQMKTLLEGTLHTVLAGARNAVADSEGKFKLEVPPGKYVLWAGPRTMGEQGWYWCEVVEVRDLPVSLILSEDSVFFYWGHGEKPQQPTHCLLRAIVSVLGLK